MSYPSMKLEQRTPKTEQDEEYSIKEAEDKQHERYTWIPQGPRPLSAKIIEKALGRNRPKIRPRSAKRNIISANIKIARPEAQNLSRMRPSNITLDKERLYDENLALKMEINACKAENTRTRTKLSQCEKELAKKNEIIEELSGIEKVPIHKNIRIVSSLKQSINDIKKELREKCEEIAKLKKNMKVSKVGELEIELQAYMDECLRLKYGMDDFIRKKAISNIYSSSPDEIKYKDSVISTLKKEKQELEIATASLKEEVIRMRDIIIENERQKKKPAKKDNVNNYKIEIQKLKSLLESLYKEKNEKEIYFTQEIAKYKQTAEDLRNLLDFAEKKNKDLIKDSEIPPKKSHKSFSSKGSSDNSAGNLKRISLQDSGNFEYSEDSPDKYGISDISPFASISNADPYQFMSPLKDLSRKVLNKVSESQSSESIEKDPGRIDGEKAYSDEFESEKNSKGEREEPTGHFNQFLYKESSEVIQESSPTNWKFKLQEDCNEEIFENKPPVNVIVDEVKPEIFGKSENIDEGNLRLFSNQEEEYSSDNENNEDKEKARHNDLASERNESKAYFDSKMSSRVSLKSKDFDEDLQDFGIVGADKSISESSKHVKIDKDKEKNSSQAKEYKYIDDPPEKSFSNEKVYAGKIISRSSSKSIAKQYSKSSESSEDSNKNAEVSLGNSELLSYSDKQIELLPQVPNNYNSSSPHDLDRNHSNHTILSNKSVRQPASPRNFPEKSVEKSKESMKDRIPSSSSHNLSVDKNANSGLNSLIIIETPAMHSISISEPAITSSNNALNEEHKSKENTIYKENSENEYEDDEFENEKKSEIDKDESYESEYMHPVELNIGNDRIISGELNRGPDIKENLKIQEEKLVTEKQTGFYVIDAPANITEIDCSNKEYEFNPQGLEKLKVKSSDSSKHFEEVRHSNQSENQSFNPANELIEKLEKFSNSSRRSLGESSQKSSKEASLKQQIFYSNGTKNKKSSKFSSKSSIKHEYYKSLHSERNEYNEDDYQLGEAEQADKEDFVKDLLANSEISNTSSKHSISIELDGKNSLLIISKNKPTSKSQIDINENPIDPNSTKIGELPKEPVAYLSSSEEVDNYSSDHEIASDSSKNAEHPESPRSKNKVTLLDNKNLIFTSEFIEDHNRHLPQERKSSESSLSKKSQRKTDKSSSSLSSSHSSKKNFKYMEESSSGLNSVESISKKSSSKSKSSSGKIKSKSSSIESKPILSSLKSKNLMTENIQDNIEEKNLNAEIHEKNLNPFLKAFVVKSINNSIQAHNDDKAPDEEESPREEIHERKLSPFMKGFVINSISESIASKMIPHDFMEIEGKLEADIPFENGESPHISSDSDDMF